MLLLEAGPSDWHPFVHMPAGLAKLVGQKGVNWDYNTAPEPQPRTVAACGGRAARCWAAPVRSTPCATSAAIARDYDEWDELGADGWYWDNVLPYFKRSEGNSRGASALHGGDGPLGVSDPRYQNPLSPVFIEAAHQAGLPLTDDFNGEYQEGVGWYQTTTRDGSRSSAAEAYLKPVRSRTNLKVHHRRDGIARDFRERPRQRRAPTRSAARRLSPKAPAREVLLCGGALNSPQLLMLSGIGPAAHLRQHGIEVLRRRCPASAATCRTISTSAPCSAAPSRSPTTRPTTLLIGLQYYLLKQGPGTSNIAETGGFLRSRFAEDARPDIQFHFVPAQLDDHGRNQLPGFGYTLHACFLRPRSRGRLSPGQHQRRRQGRASTPATSATPKATTRR